MSKTVKKILGYNVKTLLAFEFVYKLLSTIIFVPLFLSCFRWITKFSGYSYLTFENFLSFLINPLTILFLLILLIFLTFYALIDISTIIVILDSSYQEKKISMKEAFTIALEKSKRVFQRKNIGLPFLILFLIPFLNMGVSSGFISTISLPEFISDYIAHNTILSILYFLFLIRLTILLYRWLYVIHYFVLEDCDFKESRKKSIHLSHGNRVKDFVSIILTQFFLFVIYLVFILVGVFLILFLHKIFGNLNLFGNLTITIIWMLIAFSFIVVTLLSTPVSYAMISVLYYERKKKIKEKLVPISISSHQESKISSRVENLKYVLAILTLLSGTLFTYSVATGRYQFQIEYVRTMEVTAHRGASVLYPENTMSAFRGAQELSADWIELDVQQTKDGKIIVLHDTNLKRTTGVNKNTWELTYEEIEKLDAGSFFDKKYAGEKIPLLEEVLEFAKENNMKLNIELKPTGKEVDFEKSVVDLVNEYHYASSSVITSQVYEVLENVKKVDPTIKTVYVMSLAYGDITKLTAADSFSVEASSITKTLVKKVHNEGKEIYAWTVNTKENMEKMIDLKVDNIITDNITLAKNTIYESKTSNIIQEYIKFVNQLF